MWSLTLDKKQVAEFQEELSTAQCKVWPVNVSALCGKGELHSLPLSLCSSKQGKLSLSSINYLFIFSSPEPPQLFLSVPTLINQETKLGFLCSEIPGLT